jgi:hypothetical protein
LGISQRELVAPNEKLQQIALVFRQIDRARLPRLPRPPATLAPSESPARRANQTTW